MCIRDRAWNENTGAGALRDFAAGTVRLSAGSGCAGRAGQLIRRTAADADTARAGSGRAGAGAVSYTHLARIEEAKKRDHRKLGKELGLFMLTEEGPGFPFFLPKGMVLKNTLID